MRDLVEAALGEALAPDQTIAVAVSGGPDSVALLLLAARAFPGRVVALTVDHGLRAGSAAEAAIVAIECERRRIAHATLAWTGPKPRGSVQATARAARYALLADWCAGHGVTVLMTAHHADDQAETLLLRLARGSGSGGLVGIRRRRDLGRGVILLRPLLGRNRAELHAGLAETDWPVADDPSNHDPRFDRTHARRLLAATPWLDAARLAEAVAHLAEAEAALAWTADRAWAGRATATPTGLTLDIAGLPPEIVRRLAARAIARLAPDARLRGSDLAGLLDRLTVGGTATLAGVRGRGGPVWRFDPAPPRRPKPPKCTGVTTDAGQNSTG